MIYKGTLFKFTKAGEYGFKKGEVLEALNDSVDNFLSTTFVCKRASPRAKKEVAVTVFRSIQNGYYNVEIISDPALEAMLWE